MTDAEIFARAVELHGEQRRDFLREACFGDEARLRRLVKLLSADDHDDALLDQIDPVETESEAARTRSGHDIDREIGDFTIGRLLGRGGMGVVYEATQKSLNRTVALKLLSSGLGLSSRAILRFRREAEAAGKLHHTNIVPIYTTGEENGVHFYAMELIDGPSLDQVIKERQRSETASDELLAETALRLTEANANTPASETGKNETVSEQDSAANSSLRTASSSGTNSHSASLSTTSGATYFDEVATMIADVAEALDHAHEHGVIHRDVKPSNLLLGPDGRLSINDFGLARMLEQPGMTVSGEFVGSPLYMSPEQISAGRVQLDHRTDIYSLGATLYELLTHQPPFPGQTRDQVLSQVLHKEPHSTRKLNRRVPVDLDTICMKAIDKDPDRRYQTAGKLADDLRSYVNRHAISARRLSVIGKSIKFVRRNPVGTAFFGFVCAVCLIGISLWHASVVRERERMKTEIVDLAMRGRFDEARERLEKSGNSLSQGWRLLLEGQILLYEGDSEIQANDTLEKAARALPDDTAAKSLLVISYFLSGNEDEYIKRLKEVYESPANTFNEELFKGFALFWFATEEAVALLDQAIDENRSYPLAYRFRGEALAVHALNMRDRGEAEMHIKASIRDLLTAESLIGENLELNKLLTFAYLAKAIIHRDLGDTTGAQSAIEQARESAYASRDKWFITEDALYAPLCFHFVTDTEREFAKMLLQNYRQLRDLDRPRRGYTEVKIPSFFFGQDEFSVQLRTNIAFSVHDTVPSEMQSLTQYVPAFIATDSPDADQQEILRRLEMHLDSRKLGHSGTYLLLDWVALRLLDANQSQLDAVARRIHHGYSEYFVSDHRDCGRALADYMLREIDEAELEDRLRDSRSVATYAYLAIAANRIAEGNRPAARVALQQSVDEGFFLYYAPQWSKAFLRRVDDPNWLEWFPPAEAASKQNSQEVLSTTE